MPSGISPCRITANQGLVETCDWKLLVHTANSLELVPTENHWFAKKQKMDRWLICTQRPKDN